MTWKISAINNTEDAIRTIEYQDLLFENDYYWQAFRQFLQIVNIGWHSRASRILELGSGVSTVLFSEYAERTGASFYSVDTSFDRVKQVCSPNPDRLSMVERNATRLTGTTISGRMMSDFYQSGHDSLCGVSAERILNGANGFISRNIRRQIYEKIAKWLDDSDWNALRLFGRENRLTFPSVVLDHFSEQGSYAGTLDFLRRHDQTSQANLIEERHLKNTAWDLILFDCGELSSLIEFTLLADSIRPGGLAAFHDIFFPKSIKNFIVGGILAESPDWEIISMDNTTIQGMMVARKKERKI